MQTEFIVKATTFHDVKKRWRVQFSIRLLLLVVAGIGVACGWYQYSVGEFRQRRATIVELQSLGAMVYLNGSESRWATRFQDDRPPAENATGRLLFGDLYCSKVAAVKFQHTTIEDMHRMVQLVSASGAEQLLLVNAGIVDADLSDIAELESLRSLTLAGNVVTDRGLRSLARLKRLETLRLMETAVSRDAVEALRRDLPVCKINGLSE